MGLGEVCGVWGASWGFLGEFRGGFEGSWGACDAIAKMYKNLRFSMVFEISECPKKVLRGSWGWTWGVWRAPSPSWVDFVGFVRVLGVAQGSRGEVLGWVLARSVRFRERLGGSWESFGGVLKGLGTLVTL